MYALQLKYDSLNLFSDKEVIFFSQWRTDIFRCSESVTIHGYILFIFKSTFRLWVAVDIRIDFVVAFPPFVYSGKPPSNYFSSCGDGNYVVNFFHFDLFVLCSYLEICGTRKSRDRTRWAEVKLNGHTGWSLKAPSSAPLISRYIRRRALK